MEYAVGSGEKMFEGDGFDKQKLWAACNFDMRLKGIPDDIMGRVTKIDAFSVQQKPIEYAVGGLRETRKLNGRIELPNIVFYLPESCAEPFQRHATDYIQKGLEPSGSRLNGEILTYDSEGGKLFRVQFVGEIFALTHGKRTANGDDIADVKVEMYTHSMTFEHLAR
jgi:hypothetical protein